MRKAGVKHEVAEVDFDVDSLPDEITDMMMERMWGDGSLCQAVVFEQNRFERDTRIRKMELLLLDGIGTSDLITALRKDQRAVDRYLAKMEAKRAKSKK